jgi:hypothetical protein
MSTELTSWLRALDSKQFDVEGQSVTCWFGPREISRRHAVRLEATNDGIRMEATVATAKTIDFINDEDDAYLWAWRRNRASNLVGFRVDRQRRLLAEAVAPAIGLTQEEFVVYLRAVAAEADRMELVLTGRDVQ